jgi:hypothetical protein
MVTPVIDLAECPKCGAEKGKRCRNLLRRSTGTHSARSDLYEQRLARAEARAEAEAWDWGLVDGPW